MRVYAAIDLREGACVQLVGGSFECERVRLPDPVSVARRWAEGGLKFQHIVDLDRALGRGDNRKSIEQLAAEPSLSLQVGGGVRTLEDARSLFRIGVARVVVGTRAITDLAWLERLAGEFPGRIVVAADVRGEFVVVRGWTETTPLTVDAYLERVGAVPLAGVLVTAVHVEGRKVGIDEPLYERLVVQTPHPLLASGGVGNFDDLNTLERIGVDGVVVGMALYDGTLPPTELARRTRA